MELNEPKQQWGGAWTEKKLDAFSKYVWSYLKIMNSNNYWKTIYFDGFAGSGSRTSETGNELYTQLEISFDEERIYEGAAERILKMKDELKFDFYYFVDKNPDSLNQLKEHLDSVPEKKEKL